MTGTVKLQIPFECLIEAITSLNLEEKRHLQEVLEQQIFEQEEAIYEDDLDTITEIQAVRDEYARGEYQTFDEFLAHRSKSKS
ncbi:hypothetical protein [Gloeothece verrucosa]|uniref:Uncharacterized protein n=1 Tax=Gloeothece verrucosa (strain PCC 7822) TaxID=497965 RepID=E0UES3_GLOV7|nr:hypothetical protein [Gloeothece verrucosa]ADN13053.1 conserved hypothetical protein [Gloeothece verrucosa PCC 7822]